jgi:hypothetical protein
MRYVNLGHHDSLILRYLLGLVFVSLSMTPEVIILGVQRSLTYAFHYLRRYRAY